MRPYSLLVPLLVMAASLVPAADLVQEGDRWWSHIQVLAGDDMEGRNTGSPGHLRAARFLARLLEGENFRVL